MFSVDEKTTLVRVTDLRTQAGKMLRSLKQSRVIITERNTPKAVVLDYGDYKRLKGLIEMAEEGMDAIEIKTRKKRSKKFLTHKEVVALQESK